MVSKDIRQGLFATCKTIDITQLTESTLQIARIMSQIHKGFNGKMRFIIGASVPTFCFTRECKVSQGCTLTTFYEHCWIEDNVGTG